MKPTSEMDWAREARSSSERGSKRLQGLSLRRERGIEIGVFTVKGHHLVVVDSVDNEKSRVSGRPKMVE